MVRGHMRLFHHRTASQPVTDRDRDTAARLRRGDETGLRHLLQDHGGAVRARLRRKFGNSLDSSEIDEVLLLTIERVWEFGSGYDPSLGTLRGWVSVIARNLAIHHLKARHRLRGLEQTTEMDHVAEHTRAEVPVTERTKLVIDAHECLRRLPRLQREVLKADLELGDSASARELAQRLRTTPGSIYVSRLKGRRSLLRELRKLGHDLVQLEFLGTNRLNPAHG